MKKLMLNDKEITPGCHLTDPFEEGQVVGIDYQREEVYVWDGKEGWCLSLFHENLGDLKFV